MVVRKGWGVGKMRVKCGRVIERASCHPDPTHTEDPSTRSPLS